MGHAPSSPWAGGCSTCSIAHSPGCFGIAKLERVKLVFSLKVKSDIFTGEISRFFSSSGRKQELASQWLHNNVLALVTCRSVLISDAPASTR